MKQHHIYEATEKYIELTLNSFKILDFICLFILFCFFIFYKRNVTSESLRYFFFIKLKKRKYLFQYKKKIIMVNYGKLK